MIGVIDCGISNIGSVLNAIEHLGGDVNRVVHPDEVFACKKLVLPGVGSFADAMKKLEETGFSLALQKAVVSDRVPILGICLGMQLMASEGKEGGETLGLGWFPGAVKRLIPSDHGERVPHVGWNQIRILLSHPLLDGIPKEADFYFVHSYTLKAKDSAVVVATCDYCDGVTAVAAKDNIFATQFHPEKSQDHGLKILENFLDWKV